MNDLELQNHRNQKPIVQQQQNEEALVNCSRSEAALILSEICKVLQIDGQDTTVILETVNKLHRLVQAIPRLENFIKNVSRLLSDDGVEVPLDKVMGKINLMKQEVKAVREQG